MRMPNGYGSVCKLSGKRRKPWVVRKTVGWEINEETAQSKQIIATIGTYATKKEALEALANYNLHPYDIKTESVTFSEVYEKWSEEHFKNIVPAACRTWTSAYNHSKPLHNMRMRDIRASHLEGTIQNAKVGAPTKQRMKSLYNLMYRFAIKHEIVEKNYAELCDSVKQGKPTIERIPFTEDEIQKLWDNLHIDYVDMILIGIYSGWRPQELAVLQIENIDLEEKTMIGGLKTDAGKNRCVPIHPKIFQLVENRYNDAKYKNSLYLFNDPEQKKGEHLTYDRYRRRWEKAMARLEMKHRPHDTRHTFITLAKEANMNEYILKLIVGHAIRDVTEKVYTHRTMEQLHEEIKKIQ